MKSTILSIASAVSILCAVQAAQSAPIGSASRALGTSPAMIETHELRMTNAPVAYREFCGTDCAKGSYAVVIADPALLASIWTMNHEINQGQASANGCSDTALVKKSRLLSMGFPADAVKTEILRDENGVGRPALVIKTSKGDLILDQTEMRSRSRAAASQIWS